MSAVEVVVDGRNTLGEGPIWDERRGILWWVDIKGCAIHGVEPASGATRRIDLPAMVGSLVMDERGGMVVALQTGFHRLDPDTLALRPIGDPEADLPDNRFNDGKCDPAGRFWAGTMSTVARVPTGSLWRLDPDLACTRMLAGITVPNSLCWSPDGRTIYFADSPQHRIRALRFDPETGTLGDERTFAVVQDGAPDGATTDAEGFLWSAHYGAARVVRYAPDGRIDRVVTLPVSQPTACAFGGKDLDVLFITTARQNLTADRLAHEPLAGALLALRPGPVGRLEPRFSG